MSDLRSKSCIKSRLPLVPRIDQMIVWIITPQLITHHLALVKSNLDRPSPSTKARDPRLRFATVFFGMRARRHVTNHDDWQDQLANKMREKRTRFTAPPSMSN